MKNIKFCTIFAGVNGAGKSTLYSISNLANLGVRLNSDDIVRENNDSWQDMNAQIKAGKMLLNKQKECFDNGLSFNRETTLNGSNIVSTIKKAKELGYFVRLEYVGVESPEIAKKRVELRVAKGGHGVSAETIDKRFGGATENLLKVIPYCDTVAIFDNSGDEIVLVASLKNGVLQKTKVKCFWLNELIPKIEEIL